MAFLRGLFWFLFAIAIIAVAMYITGNYQWADRLTSVFLAVQDKLPITVNFDQFLVGATILSLLVGGLVLAGCTALLVFMGLRLSLVYQRQAAQSAASKKELKHLAEQHQRHYDTLVTLGQTLTKQLDKRVIGQTIVEAASRITSVPQANTIASLWLLDFEKDIFRFEFGRYCDQSIFIQSDFQPMWQPFARVISSQKPCILAEQESLALLRPEKIAQIGAANRALVIPLIVEGTALGILTLFCHPDTIKGYEVERPFYDTMWSELMLALAIAVQGEIAILDRLTGVHNREYFMKRFIQEIERADRFQFPLALLMVDIDNFKLVNDMLGHPQGDAVLRIVAKLLRKEIRAIDLAGRYGGEEFIILLPETGFGDEATSSSGALAVAERIRKAVDDEFHGLQKPLNLTVSVGVVVRRFPDDRAMDYRELIRLADEQLYRAKTTGKNKVCAVIPETPQEVS